MEKFSKYTIVPASEIPKGEKGYLIVTDNQFPIKTHLGADYIPLSKKSANLLVNDINEILLLDTCLDKGNTKKGLTTKEVSCHPNFKKIREQQEKMSFSVCVFNTFISLGEGSGFTIQLDKHIQWDFLYRMSPGPHKKMEQVIAAGPALSWLGSDWKDLSGNYTGSIEEMEMDEVPFVAQSLIDRLTAELDSMVMVEKVAVWYLYEFFQRFSITLPILWVKGLIPGSVLEDSYYLMTSDLSLKSIEKIRKEEGEFVQRRLMYLKKFLNAIKSTKSDKKYPVRGI